MTQTFAVAPPPVLYSQEVVNDTAQPELALPPKESAASTACANIASARRLIALFRERVDKDNVLHSLPSGPVKQVYLSRHWLKNDLAGKIYGRTQFERQGDASTRITVRMSSLALCPSTRASLISIVRESRQRSGANSRILFADSIEKLSEFFGSATVGRNQYSAKKRNDGVKQLFHFDSATLIWLQGQAAILVEGKILNAEGKVSRYFIGTFVPYESDKGTKVMELAMTTETRDAYLLHKAEYKQVLQSLVPAA